VFICVHLWLIFAPDYTSFKYKPEGADFWVKNAIFLAKLTGFEFLSTVMMSGSDFFSFRAGRI